MGAVEERPGARPGPAAPAIRRVHSENGHPGFDLDPAPLSTLKGVPAELINEARRSHANLERRLADRELRDQLAADKFTGPRYERFETELARYGISVLRGWMHSGFIFKVTAGRGFALHPTEEELEELYRDSDAREELANMTVARALPRFREHALIDGGWRHDGGASIATYFVGSCVYVFPNEFRSRRRDRERWRWQDRWDSTVEYARDPAELATCGIINQEEVSSVDDRKRAIVGLAAAGYTHEEIKELLGEKSVRAIEGVIYRWRTKEGSRLRGGG